MRQKTLILFNQPSFDNNTGDVGKAVFAPLVLVQGAGSVGVQFWSVPDDPGEPAFQNAEGLTVAYSCLLLFQGEHASQDSQERARAPRLRCPSYRPRGVC